ncbi:MAG TPA: ABC transporter ATP-binding protein [Bacteroidota bacterium]
MPELTIHISDVKKVYGRRVIFEGIRGTLRSTDALAITGRNGSGKSTLAKILAGLLTPNAGSITYERQSQRIETRDFHRHLGFVAPYLQLYDEFTGYENLDLFARLRALRLPAEMCDRLLDLVGLASSRNELVRNFSSGMKQRLKYAFALLNQPPLLILDEPTANLDSEGIALARGLMKDQCKDGILVVATNDRNDQNLCNRLINLDEHPNIMTEIGR